MNELFEYKCPQTGYTIKQFTKSTGRSSKLYFSTESFTSDDKYFFYNRDDEDVNKKGMYRVEYATGNQEHILSHEYSRFAMDYLRDLAYVCKGEAVYKMDVFSGKLTHVGDFPKGGVPTSHLSASKSGLIWCSYHQENKIYALVVLDPATGKSEVVWQDDHRLGHCQACPGDDGTVMYIHETTGDALQRIWMFDYPTRRVRPFYVEKEGDWITHEVWDHTGDHLYFMRYPHDIMRGTRDGHNFKVMANSTQYLHVAPSRCGKWITADRMTGVLKGWKNEIVLINAETGKEHTLAATAEPTTGAEHPHPSFNRSGNVVLFSNPIDKGLCNVAAIEIDQAKAALL